MTPDLAIDGIVIICIFLFALALGIIFNTLTVCLVRIIERIKDMIAAIGNWVWGIWEGEP